MQVAELMVRLTPLHYSIDSDGEKTKLNLILQVPEALLREPAFNTFAIEIFYVNQFEDSIDTGTVQRNIQQLFR